MNELALFAGAGGGFSVEKYLAGIRSERSKLNQQHGKCCLPDSETESCHNSQFGTMSQHLTANHGAALSTLSPEDSLVKTSVAQEKAQESTGNVAAYGPKCAELLARYDRDSHSWRIPQCSLFADLTECLQTLPKSGTMHNGKLYRRSKLAHLIKENEYGYLLPTPTCRGLDGGTHSRERLRHLFPTPTCTLAPNKNANTKGPKSLAEVAQTNWKPGETWPTPQASDWKRDGMSADSIQKRIANNKQIGLPETVTIRQMWLTPTASDALCSKFSQQANVNHWNKHPRANLTAQLATRDQANGQHWATGGKLNPDWVEWLMGWPIGWTDLKPLEMAKFRSWQQQHSVFLTNQ